MIPARSSISTASSVRAPLRFPPDDDAELDRWCGQLAEFVGDLAESPGVELCTAGPRRHARHDHLRNVVPPPLPDAPQYHIQSGGGPCDAFLAVGEDGDADAGVGRRPQM